MKSYCILLLAAFGLGLVQLNAQNQVGINTPTVDASAIIEMQSTSAGALIPRMSRNQRLAISNPANGLLVYETNSNTFWYAASGSWNEIISNNQIQDGLGDADADTKIANEATDDNDQIRFYTSGLEYFRMNNHQLLVISTGNSIWVGDSAGYSDDRSSNNNVFVGKNAGMFNTSGSRNVALGYESMKFNTAASDVVCIGKNAGRGFEDSRRNVAIGNNSLLLNDSADFHVSVGHNAMSNHIDRNNNFALGIFALGNSSNSRSHSAIGNLSLSGGISNGFCTAVGYSAGRSTTANNSIFIGHESGRFNTSGNRLFIDNNNTSTPLIWANFSQDSIIINGDLHVTGNISYVGNLTDVSDRRLKTNILREANILPRLKELKAYRYHLKSAPPNQKEIGLIAQEVEGAFPMITKKIFDGYIGVSYPQFIPLLIEAEKEQQQMLNQRETEINTLNAEIDQVAKEIEELKAIAQSRASSQPNNW